MQGQKLKYLQNNKPAGNSTFFQAVKQIKHNTASWKQIALCWEKSTQRLLFCLKNSVLSGCQLRHGHDG